MARQSVPSQSSEGPAIEHVDEMVLGGKKVRVLSAELPLDNVYLDPTNPRIANTVSLSRFNEQELDVKLAELLWQDRDLQDLYRSVHANNGLVERIIVRNNYVVAEGNCRTVVYRKLREAEPKNPAWRSISARVLPDDITDRQVAILLGELHVGGKNAWSPFEKAGHMHELFHEHGLVQDEIAKLLRTSKTSVNHNIRTFDAMKRYMVAFPGPGAVRKFSYFLELYKKPVLRDWVTRNPEALDDFVNWVGTGRLEKGVEVRDLADIVTNKRALAAFGQGGRSEAMKVLEEEKPERVSPLFRLMVEMSAALRDARLDDIQRVRKDRSGAAKSIVRDLKSNFDRFVDLCDGLD